MHVYLPKKLFVDMIKHCGGGLHIGGKQRYLRQYGGVKMEVMLLKFKF